MSSVNNINRIAILGAESSGKSQLAEALASRYQTVWVPEYLREFVDAKQRVPQEDEQLLIATTQLQRENEAAKTANAWLFCDTTPLMTAIYSRHYFARVDAALEELEQEHDYDFTLVTAPDFPWTADGLQRESAAVRQRIHENLLSLLEERDIPFLLVEGSLKDRVEQVAFALDFLLE
ncbi:ATP-binding protein [Undibacterium piscinae]|jgi:NadR type nicotinamide-nucleotide adenylyltransferase|uniref:ATP-binding protein n=1 Tax=Undibacterium piscinae TaxID=2495591 RepID=A0A6M4A525_9BURK|nr:ATP-binding protein [Undibacterium piscinae]